MTHRLCALGLRLRCPRRMLPSTSCTSPVRYSSSSTSEGHKLSILPPGLQKLAKMKLEDLHHINPGPPTTYDDVAIPFKSFEEAKKDFMPTFNLYFWSSFLLFAVTSYWAFFIEDIYPYDVRSPVKSYRDRHKGKKPLEPPDDDGSSDKKSLAAAAAAVGTALLTEESKKVKN